VIEEVCCTFISTFLLYKNNLGLVCLLPKHFGYFWPITGKEIFHKI
jgi:hypothetical protein